MSISQDGAGSHLICVMLDHPQSVIVGLSLVLRFGLDPIYSFGDIAIYTHRRFGLKCAIRPISEGLGSIFPKCGYPSVSPLASRTKETSLLLTDVRANKHATLMCYTHNEHIYICKLV